VASKKWVNIYLIKRTINGQRMLIVRAYIYHRYYNKIILFNIVDFTKWTILNCSF